MVVIMSLTKGMLMLMVILSVASQGYGIGEPLILTPDTINADSYGGAMAAYGDVMVATASGTTGGVDGDYGWGAGAAFIFTENPAVVGDWREVQKIYPGDPVKETYFGCSVAVWKRIILIGAYHDDTHGSFSGAAYVFAENAVGSEVWEETQKLVASDATSGRSFGRYLGMSDGVMAISSALEGGYTGSAYFFHQIGGEWLEYKKVNASDGQPGDYFGQDIDVANSKAFIGTNQAYNCTVYVFDTATGKEEQRLWSGEVDDNFGNKIDASGTSLAVSAPYSGDDFGSVYVYRDDPSVGKYILIEIFENPNGNQPSGLFAYSMSLSGSVLVAGYPRYDCCSVQNTGAAYVWVELREDEWVYEGEVLALSMNANRQFGLFVAAVEPWIFIADPIHPKSTYVYNVTKEPCASNPCQNGGACSFGTELECACVPGFAGGMCLTNIDDCIDHECASNATCVDGVHEYTCICPPGYTGEYCATDIDECLSDPCLNDGMCTEDIIGSFMCTCADAYEGALCETEVNECESSPCENGATCSDELGGFSCACAIGFEGGQCETDGNDCLSAPCLNGGACADDGPSAFSCDCSGTGFEGSTCMIELDECLSFPCFNNATCIDVGPLAIRCACSAGFTGHFCETDINDCHSSPCLNGASCTDAGPTMFTCDCGLSGYTGDVCNVDIDDCASMPCPSDQICIDDVANFDCTDPCLTGPCANGQGCQVMNNSYICFEYVTALFQDLICLEEEVDCTNSNAIEVYLLNELTDELGGAEGDYNVTVVLNDGTVIVTYNAEIEFKDLDGIYDGNAAAFANDIEQGSPTVYVRSSGWASSYENVAPRNVPHSAGFLLAILFVLVV